jgi:hypothetical protein
MWLVNNFVLACNVNGLDNLTIVQHWNTHFSMPLFGEVVINLKFLYLIQKDYVYLQQTTPTILNVITRYVIVSVQNVVVGGSRW